MPKAKRKSKQAYLNRMASDMRSGRLVPRCLQCRKHPALSPDIYAARLEDIPDGPMLTLPERLCEDCLEAIAEECHRIAEEG